MIKLITEKLEEEIRALVDESCQIKVLTAFLKLSGIDIFRHIPNKNIQIITGIDFFITDPNAVLDLKKNGYDIKVFYQPKKVFHPKCFYIKTSRKEYLIIGSSNITFGGMANNYEASLTIVLKMKKYFRILMHILKK
jgi:HKD family nuclease